MILPRPRGSHSGPVVRTAERGWACLTPGGEDGAGHQATGAWAVRSAKGRSGFPSHTLLFKSDPCHGCKIEFVTGKEANELEVCWHEGLTRGRPRRRGAREGRCSHRQSVTLWVQDGGRTPRQPPRRARLCGAGLAQAGVTAGTQARGDSVRT